MSARIRHQVDDEDKGLAAFHSTHVNARNPSTVVTFTQQLNNVISLLQFFYALYVWNCSLHLFVMPLYDMSCIRPICEELLSSIIQTIYERKVEE